MDSDVEEIETFCAELSEILKLMKKHDLNTIMEDFNAKVGNKPVPEIVGNYGLRLKNKCGDRLNQSYLEHGFKIYNIFLQLPLRRLYGFMEIATGSQSKCHSKSNN